MMPSLIDRSLRGQRWLERAGDLMQKVVGGVYGRLGLPGRRLKSFLHGTSVGHALHPMLTDVPLGAWTVAFVADLAFYGVHLSASVAEFCTFIGLLGALGAVVTGYTDHHETYGHERTVATAHGLAMTIATGLYAASLLMRWLSPGLHGLAVLLSLVGYGVVLGGASLGGDLVYGMGTMVNRNAFVEGPEEEFVEVGRPEDFPEGQMRRVQAGGMAVLVVRVGDRLHAISNVCSHAGGPLDEGELQGTTVTCPWHASEFDVTTGRVRCGPATFDQPTFLIQETEDYVGVKLARSLHG